MQSEMLNRAANNLLVIGILFGFVLMYLSKMRKQSAMETLKKMKDFMTGMAGGDKK